MGNLLAMGVFALTMSISPGPANMITLSAGLHHGARRALPFVLGCTIGFTALLVTIGLAASLMARLGPVWQIGMAVLGAAVIVYFGVRIAFAPTGLQTEERPALPGLWQGVLLQWVNPKAWGACLAAVSADSWSHPCACGCSILRSAERWCCWRQGLSPTGLCALRRADPVSF